MVKDDPHDPVEHLEQAAFRRRLTRWLAGFMTLFILLATIIRPVFVELSPTFMLIGFFNVGVAASIYFATANDKFARFAPFALCLLGAVLLVPLMLISGGVNSQFAFMAPLLPIVCALLAGRRMAVYIAIILAVFMVLLLLFAESIPDLTGEPFHPAKTISRAMWLVLAIVLGTVFSWQFDAALSRLQGQLRRQATRDPLTGLANRRALDAFLEEQSARAARTGSQLTLLMIDVDHFKSFNDQYGHATGDACLREVGKTLRDNTRAGQDFAARFGGEEFVVVLTDTSASKALVAAEHLRTAIEELPAIAPATHGVTVTIGVATELGFTSAQTLFERADAALYEGKRAGRNRVTTLATT